MAKEKIVVAKVVVGIICALLIIGAVTTFSILCVSLGAGHDPFGLISSYDNLPNVVGENGVYISKNFYIENYLEIPQYAVFYHATRGDHNSVYIKDANKFYDGRASQLAYRFGSSSIDGDERGKINVNFICNPVKIEKLTNTQKYNGYTYGLTMEEYVAEQKKNIKTPYIRYIYTLNFKRNANTSKKCQLTMTVSIEQGDDFQLEKFKNRCDELFYSMLDNVVYRNI